MKYPGAEIIKKDNQWWIEFDFGEVGPFDSYDDAAQQAEQNDEPMEVCM